MSFYSIWLYALSDPVCLFLIEQNNTFATNKKQWIHVLMQLLCGSLPNFGNDFARRGLQEGKLIEISQQLDKLGTEVTGML